MALIDFGAWHLVTVQLKNRNSVCTQVMELREIKDWLDELVEWQLEHYHCVMRKHGLVDIWFKHDKHAAMCALRWG